MATDQRPATNDQLIRGVGLGTATALNMIDMIGVGPFITIPLIISAMGGPQAMLGWILGAFFAICDGLVWAELGAAMPGSGGSYRYLREIYGSKKLGKLISFLFIWQLRSQLLFPLPPEPSDWRAMFHSFGRPRTALYLTNMDAESCPYGIAGNPLAGFRRNIRSNRRHSGGVVAALSQDHQHWLALKGFVGRRRRHDDLDHYLRADPLQSRPRAKFSAQRVPAFATFFLD